MLSRLRLCRRAYDGAARTRSNSFLRWCSSSERTARILHSLGASLGFELEWCCGCGGRQPYSTSAKSRFDRAADAECEQQFTATYVAPAPRGAGDTAPLQPPSTASAPDGTTTAAESPPALRAAAAAASAPLPPRSEPSTPTTPEVAKVSKEPDLFALLSGQSTLPTPETAPSLPAGDSVEKSALTHSPLPIALLPPLPQNVRRVPLLSLPRTDPASRGLDSAVLNPLLSHSETASTPTVERYACIINQSFINPFDGRLIRDDRPLAKLLFRTGFYRSLFNPLHLEWSPTEYVTALQRCMADEQRKQESRQQARARLERQEKRLALAEAKERHQHHKKRVSGSGTPPMIASDTESPAPVDASSAPSIVDVVTANVQVRDQSPQPSAGTASAAELVRMARTKLLQPLRRRGPEHWTYAVADIIVRQDVFTYMNKELERRYAGLCNAYVPPKLDTTVDPSVAGVELTPDQKRVLQLALRGFNIFVGGSAGTGKTVLLKFIFRELTLLGLRVAVTATTGVAAVQLGGCTFHHAFNVPIAGEPHRWDVNALRAVDVVIIDEASLIDANMFDAFDMEARLARMQHTPFGGLQVIVCGDFLQLSRDDAMPACESAAFKYLIATRLVTPMRHRAGEPLLKLLEQLRQGEFDSQQFAALDREIPPTTTHVTYIFPRRREAQKLNDQKLSELGSQEMTLTPQRGPLQLCGTFTPSALLEMSRDEQGMHRPLPRREQLIDMLHEELVRCGGAPYCIADHELVMMPVRTDTTAVMRFVLRLRCRDVRKETVTEAGTSPAPAGAAAAAVTKSSDGGDTSSAVDVATGSARDPKLVSRSVAKAPRSTSPFTDAEWERIASAVAQRLGGRLVCMFPVEPTSLVPLSVSMTLADMCSPDIAHSLSPLRLKLGCRVMVNRNLSRTVSNGSVGIVEAFAPPDPGLFPRSCDRSRRIAQRHRSHSQNFDELPVVRLLSGEVVQVPAVATRVGGTAQSYYYGHEVFTIPLQLGYAFTVHKVQGLTLQGTVVVDCAHFFECPHLIYVACSRVRSLDQLVVRHVEPKMIIVRRSALEFSNSLLEACSLNDESIPSSCARGSWADRVSQRIFTVTD